VARWPMVNLVHTLLAPLLMLGRGLAGAGGSAGPMPTPRGVVEQAIRNTSPPLPRRVQAAFMSLRQTSPVLVELYPASKPWEDFGADQACEQLAGDLAATLNRQRARGLHRGAWSLIGGAPMRWLLTIGALLWFPFVQPILQTILALATRPSLPRIGGMIVEVLGVDYLLRSAIFLLIYYTVLWLALRWNTQRRVKRLLGRMTRRSGKDDAIDLTSAAAGWMERLLDPIRDAQDRAKDLADRAAKFLPPKTQ
jgi:hypothetical protein